MRQPGLVTAFLACTVLAIGLQGMVPAHARMATGTCVGDGTHKYTGRGFDPSYKVRGAKADIQIQEGYLCSSGALLSVSSWPMVFAYNAAYRYGQIGYKKYTQQCGIGCFITIKNYFYEYANSTDGHDAVIVVWGNPDIGTYHNFRVTRWQSDGHLHFDLDESPAPAGTPETPFDPLSWSNPVSQWMEESNDTGNDVPGTSASPVVDDNVMTKDDSESWVNQNWNFTAQDLGENYCAYRTIELTSTSKFKSFTDRGNC